MQACDVTLWGTIWRLKRQWEKGVGREVLQNQLSILQITQQSPFTSLSCKNHQPTYTRNLDMTLPSLWTPVVDSESLCPAFVLVSQPKGQIHCPYFNFILYFGPPIRWWWEKSCPSLRNHTPKPCKYSWPLNLLQCKKQMNHLFSTHHKRKIGRARQWTREEVAK